MSRLIWVFTGAYVILKALLYPELICSWCLKGTCFSEQFHRNCQESVMWPILFFLRCKLCFVALKKSFCELDQTANVFYLQIHDLILDWLFGFSWRLSAFSPATWLAWWPMSQIILKGCKPHIKKIKTLTRGNNPNKACILTLTETNKRISFGTLSFSHCIKGQFGLTMPPPPPPTCKVWGVGGCILFSGWSVMPWFRDSDLVSAE